MEIVNPSLTENVLDPQLYARLQLTGIEALRRYGITGAGVKIAVVDYPHAFPGEAKSPHFWEFNYCFKLI